MAASVDGIVTGGRRSAEREADFMIPVHRSTGPGPAP